MKKTRIMARYTIYSEEDFFLPEYATEALSIKPSEIKRKGQIIKKTLGELIMKESSWSVKTDYEESLDMYNQVNKLIKLLKGKENVICNIHEKYKTRNLFLVVIEVVDREFPYIDIEKTFLDYLNSINAIVRFDIYILDIIK